MEHDLIIIYDLELELELELVVASVCLAKSFDISPLIFKKKERQKRKLKQERKSKQQIRASKRD